MSAFFSWQHAILKAALEPTTKHVCLTIGCHMAMDGSGCFPSYNLIAEESGLSRRAVILHVGKAAEAGYLEIEGRDRENGSHSSNLYRPTMPGGGAPDALGGARGALGGGAPRAPLLTPHSSNTSINSTPLPPSRFEDFWAAWPKHNRKVNKPGCLKAWKARNLDAKADEVIAALEAFKASWDWQKNDGAYVPMPATWLHQERWTNPPTVTAPMDPDEIPF